MQCYSFKVIANSTKKIWLIFNLARAENQKLTISKDILHIFNKVISSNNY